MTHPAPTPRRKSRLWAYGLIGSLVFLGMSVFLMMNAYSPDGQQANILTMVALATTGLSLVCLLVFFVGIVIKIGERNTRKALAAATDFE